MLLGNLKYLKIGRFTLEKETVRISLSTPAGAAKDEGIWVQRVLVAMTFFEELYS
jgi:hypothetical protein